MNDPGNEPPLDQLLERARSGDRIAAEQLFPRIYDELRRLAQARLNRERPGQTLQPTALVHEAFLRVVGKGDPGWDGQHHLMGAIGEAMRRILVDQARHKEHRRKHRGRLEAAGEVLLEPPDEHVLDVHEALQRLERDDPRKGRIVEMRYFCGLTNEETARALDVSVATVERDWRFIMAYLRRELRDEAGHSD